MRNSDRQMQLAGIFHLQGGLSYTSVVSHGWRFVRRYPLGAAGAIALISLVLVAIFASILAPYDPIATDFSNRLHKPGRDFWMGTDFLGRDVLSRIMFGSRTSLYVGFLSVLMGTVAGVTIGTTSGYLGGRFDLLLQRLVDSFMGFPSLVLALVMVVGLGASLASVIIAIALSLTPRLARLSRATALSIKEEVYVLGARAIGCGPARIMTRYILPNSLAPIFVLATGYLGSAIVTEASLSFLGLGVPPPNPSWGGMLRQGATQRLEVAPWIAIFPGLALSMVVFAFALLGDALRDALDPRLRRG